MNKDNVNMFGTSFNLAITTKYTRSDGQKILYADSNEDGFLSWTELSNWLLDYNTLLDKFSVIMTGKFSPIEGLNLDYDPYQELVLSKDLWTPQAFTTITDPNRYIVGVQANTAPVPEPSTVILLGMGLAGIAYAGRRTRRVHM